MSSGPKLKESHHINCSLLTLGTVIRKLSKGKQGHINYRDSKLTRILQSSLGGNARTAIICTLSPARCHVEQSRNTLLFASCAKEVSTNASLNVVTSDKFMVQHLQNQVSRLENELKEKDSQIEEMERVIRKISKQRDLAESRVEDLLLVNENLRSTMKTLSQSADAHVFVENIKEELLENKEEKAFNGDSLSHSSSKSRSSTESAFAEALVQNLQAAEEDGVLSVHSFVKELKEAQVRLEEQLDGQEMISLHGKLNDSNNVSLEHPEAHSDWPQLFAKFQKAIINLWQSCNVSLVHRTYFFLLFKGDPTDSIYMEVELRRLTFLEKTYSTKNQLPEDDHHSFASSGKALCQERKKLSKLMQKRYTKEERDKLFQKWGIDLESKKRKIQLINSIWNNAHDLQHISDSAEIVAKLIKFSEQGQGIKGMLGLSFDSPQCKRRSVSLRESIASLI